MRKSLLLLCFFLSAGMALGQTKAYDTIQYAKEYYQKRMELFKSEPLVKGKMIFLGNSITEFGDWQKLLNDSTIINRGIAGDNTFGVLARLDEVIQHEPSKLFLKIGINDISQNIPDEIIVKNISTIIERLKAESPSTRIYLHSILPTNENVKNEYPDAYNKNNTVRLVNKQLMEQAYKHHIAYIDINKLFSDKNGDLDAIYAAADGLHLIELAYATWVKFLKTKKYL